jgi:pimeloyl-ACP methyl ester carboxylesterase
MRRLIRPMLCVCLPLYVISVQFLTLNEPLAAQPTVSPQRNVNVGNLRTRILTIGIEDRKPGEPVVIFQNGLGSTMATWDAVIEEVVPFAAVLAYDRPGTGESEGDSNPPTFQRVSLHLQELLSVLETPPPYVLVGHSWGGPLIQHYASEHPADVVGLVFVDPTDWTQEGIFPVDRAALSSQGFNEAQVDSLVMLRDSLVLEWQSSMDEWAADSPGVAAEWQVFKSFMSSPSAERELPLSLRVPTTILVAGRIEPLMQFPENLVTAYRASRYKSFSHLILNLPEAMLIIDTDVGHEIHVEDPTLVSEAIRRVVFHR